MKRERRGLGLERTEREREGLRGERRGNEERKRRRRAVTCGILLSIHWCICISCKGFRIEKREMKASLICAQFSKIGTSKFKVSNPSLTLFGPLAFSLALFFFKKKKEKRKQFHR